MKSKLKYLWTLIFFLMLVEGMSRIYFHVRYPNMIEEIRFEPKTVRGNWRKLPYEIPLIDGEIIRAKRGGGEIFRHKFSIGPDSTRGKSLPTRQGLGLFFVGCSFTFGPGVSDEDTLPMQTQKNLSAAKSYNYGVSGASPIEILLRLQNLEQADMPESQRMIIYTFFDDHLPRHIWYYPYVGAWGFERNVYERNGSEIKSLGKFEEKFPVKTQLIKLLTRSGIYRLLNPYKITVSDEASRQDFVEVISLMKERSQALNAEFVVLIWPGSRNGKWLIDSLSRKNIEYADFSDMNLQKLLGPNKPAYIRHDHHPTADSYSIVAKQLAEILKKDQKKK